MGDPKTMSLIEEMEAIGEGNTNQSDVVASCFAPEQNANGFAVDDSMNRRV